MIATPLALVRRFTADKRGNVLMIFAFAVIPMVFATGMGIDYARAARLRTKLDAIADAAALAAVAQPQMNDPSDADATAVAQKMFDAQADGLPGLDGLPKVTIKITHPNGTTSRVAQVSYTANSLNAFGSVLKMRTIPIGGTSSATATAAPNMDFYIALDTSPSMALPTTSDGIQAMDTALNCSFACHSNKIQNYVKANQVGYLPTLILDNTHFKINKTASISGTYGGNSIYYIDSSKSTFVYNNKTKNIASGCSNGSKDICVYNADGTFVDSYWYALNQGLSMRVTDERSAVKELMDVAASYAAVNNRVYHAGVYTFDHSTNFKTIMSMPSPSAASNLDAVKTAADKIDLVQVNDQQTNGCPPTKCSTSNPDNRYLFTSFKSLLDQMAGVNGQPGILPSKSGQGSNEPGDTPQGYLFMVTDGMSDEQSSIIKAPGSLGADRTRSEIVQAHIDQCNAIKARGFKIAILYTEYTSESIKDDEPNQRDFVTANIPDVAPALTACASPGLMYTVKTDQSISDALQALFAKAVANARLNQ
jgi:Flp pilus assembly protein TadG